MVNNNKRRITKYRKNNKAYHKKNIETGQNSKKQKKDYYVETMSALITYLKENEENPNENKWNHYAVENGYLTSKSIGYLSKINFNTLCRKLRKKINYEKRKNEK